MGVDVLHRALRRHQRLRQHLPAEHPPDMGAPIGRRVAGAEQIGVQRLEIEQADEFGKGGHARSGN